MHNESCYPIVSFVMFNLYELLHYKKNLAIFWMTLVYDAGLKTLAQQGILEPVFYGNLVDKFKRIVGKRT